ncbi:hypothetical protein JHK86_050426 [Glycine max]|nr:hypothetical protein JHK86_050426 [Glycine max]
MVRVLHLWMVSDVSNNKQTSSSRIPLSMEMVLVDSKGDRVHGSVKQTFIYKFDKALQEGKWYSIQFFGVAENGVFGTVKHVVDDEEWWYTACTCNKSVYPDSNMLFCCCEKYNKHVTNVVLRYFIKVRVIDESDSATFVIFDRDATILFSKSCANMFETYKKRGLAGTFPREIINLVDRLKGKTDAVGMDVEPMQSQSSEMHLLLKSLKKRIKVENI